MFRWMPYSGAEYRSSRAFGLPVLSRSPSLALALRPSPMAGVINGFRWAITGRGHYPGMLLLASSAVVALIVLGGLFFFNRMESSVADRV
jgi:lipopolysaccharide transport system permease protein